MITDEQSKAAQEVAKTTGKFAEIADKVGGFVSKVIGGTSEQIGGIFEDSMRYYRFINLLSIADKVEAIHAKRKILGKTNPVPPRLAIPMLDSAALEDDETLQTVWARLIANSTDPKFNQPIHPGYIEVIRQLCPDESIILKSFFEIKRYPIIFHGSDVYQLSFQKAHELENNKEFIKRKRQGYGLAAFVCETHCRTLPLKNVNNISVYIDNLMRLRVIESGTVFSKSTERRDVENSSGDTVGEVEVTEPEQIEYLRITTFGKDLMTACIADPA